MEGELMAELLFDDVVEEINTLYKLMEEQYQVWKDARSTNKTVKAICDVKAHLFSMKLCLEKKEITAFIKVFHQGFAVHDIQDCFRSRAKANYHCATSKELAVKAVRRICTKMKKLVEHSKAQDIFSYIDWKTYEKKTI